MTVSVLPVILWAERNRRILEDAFEAQTPISLRGLHGGLTEVRSRIHRKGGQHIKPGKEQSAVGDREEQLLERPVDAAWRIVHRGTAHRHAQQRPLALECTVAITIAIAGPFVAISQAISKNTVDPALEDGGHAKPPQRKMKNHGVGCEQLLLLRSDVSGLKSLRISVPRFGHERQSVRINTDRKILRIVYGFPAHSVQIRLQHAMPLFLKHLHGYVDELASNRCGLGMCENDQNLLHRLNSIQRRAHRARWLDARVLGPPGLFLKFKEFWATICPMDTRRLDLNLLVTLEALLLERNVTRAAARLHLSQPAVSAQLNRLRDLFGDSLLVPAQRGMTPTAKAIELLEPLRQALDQVRATLVTHRDFEPARAKLVVTIACTDYLQAAVVNPFVVELRATAPGVRVALRNLDTARLEEQMTRGDVDLALMTPQAAPPLLRSRHLFDERYVLIGRRNHPRLRDSISVAEFAQLDHVIVSLKGGDFVTPVDTALAAFGHSRNVVLSAASFLYVPEIVSRSDFVALVPERLVRNWGDKLKLMDCPFPVEGFAVGLVWHERTHNHSGQRWVRDAIVTLSDAEAGKSSRPTPGRRAKQDRVTRRVRSPRTM